MKSRGWTIFMATLAGYNINTAIDAAIDGQAWLALVCSLGFVAGLFAAVVRSRPEHA